MTIVGFNFTSIEASKNEGSKGKVNINNNVTIDNVEEKDLALGDEKNKVLSFNFLFTSVYDPDIGTIKLKGNTLYMADSKKAKPILENWEKEKKLPKELTSNILNVILNKCNIQSLILSEKINLPPPIPLPKVQVNKGNEEKKE